MKPWIIWYKSKPGTLNVNKIIQDMQTSSKIFFYLEIRAKTESRLIAMKVNRLLKSKVHGPPLNPADEET